MIEIIKKTKIDFMGLKNIAFAISALLAALGIFTIIQVSQGKANMGIDFVGGTAVQIQFSEPVPLTDLRAALETTDLEGFELQDLPTERKVLISIKKTEDTLGGFSDLIIKTLSEKFADKNPIVDSTTQIGPKVGERLRNDAVLAIFAATIGILIYVGFRFQYRFGIGATVATFHDVLAVLGFFYLMGKEINLVLVSALLMIAGYSLTDTVVVFDRIRENLRARLKLSVDEIVNLSINEVLSRTVIVSLTTLISALSLFYFGGEVIHDFSLAIILGVLVGNYSSIFVASPVVVALGGKKGFNKR